MAELSLMESENRLYARAAARELAASLIDQIEQAVELIQKQCGRKVRLALSVTFARDDESGEIRPEYSVKRSQIEEVKKLPGIPLGPQSAFPELRGAGLALSDCDDPAWSGEEIQERE